MAFFKSKVNLNVVPYEAEYDSATGITYMRWDGDDVNPIGIIEKTVIVAGTKTTTKYESCSKHKWSDRATIPAGDYRPVHNDGTILTPLNRP